MQAASRKESPGAPFNDAGGVVQSQPLLPLPQGSCVAAFVRRVKRFSIEVSRLDALGREVNFWAHSNNSGSMLGLVRPGSPVLLSPAANASRKLPWTQECVWLAAGSAEDLASCAKDARRGRLPGGQGFWVGVNTSVPNRLLEAAFKAGRLSFAAGYTGFRREARRGQSRLDALLTSPDLPPLWVECKNVTLVEDGIACFPDAASQRGCKHLQELMDIVAQGERAAMFYLVQRPDGQCFGPADFIDPEYARLFQAALAQGVEICPFRAKVGPGGIDLGERLPLAPQLAPQLAPKLAPERKAE